MKKSNIPDAMEVFADLGRLARLHQRAPFATTWLGDRNHAFGYYFDWFSSEGMVRSETYQKNYRVIQIMTGPDKGCRTKEPPVGTGPPWKVIYNHKEE